MKKPLKKGINYTLSVVVGFGLLGGVLYYVGWRGIFAQINALGVAGIAGIAGDVLLTIVAWILSWGVILRSYGITLSLNSVTAARLSGYAISYLTPTLYFGGEPIRALMVVDRTPAPATRIFATIVVERFLGGLSLIVFVLIGSFYALISPISPGVGVTEKEVVLIGVPFILFWIVIGLINFAGNFKWISRAIRLLRHPLPRWKQAFEYAAGKVSETEDEIYEAFTRHWRGTLLAFLIQSLATFFVYMRPQVFFHFSAHTTFSFPQLSLLFTLNIMLSFFLWITPGGLGTSEAALIGIYKLVGVGKEGAVAFSLVFKFVELLFVVAGLTYLFNRGLRRTSRRSEDRLSVCPAEEGSDPPFARSDPTDTLQKEC